MTDTGTDGTTMQHVRAAEETVTRARVALEEAESGLRIAEEVAEEADQPRSYAALMVLGAFATFGVLVLVIAKMRRRAIDGGPGG